MIARCRRPHCGGALLTFDDGQDVSRRCLLCGRGDDWTKVIAPRTEARPAGGSLIERLLSDGPPTPTMLTAIDSFRYESIQRGRVRWWQADLRGAGDCKTLTLPPSTGRTWTKRLDGDWNGGTDNVARLAELEREYGG